MEEDGVYLWLNMTSCLGSAELVLLPRAPVVFFLTEINTSEKTLMKNLSLQSDMGSVYSQ